MTLRSSYDISYFSYLFEKYFLHGNADKMTEKYIKIEVLNIF